MARSTTRSLAGKAASAARKVVNRRSPRRRVQRHGERGHRRPAAKKTAPVKKTAPKAAAGREEGSREEGSRQEGGSGREEGSCEEGGAREEGAGHEGRGGCEEGRCEEGGSAKKAAPAAKRAPAAKAPAAKAPAKKAPAKKAPRQEGGAGREEAAGREGRCQRCVGCEEGRARRHVPTSEEGSHGHGHQDRHQDRHQEVTRPKAPRKKTVAPSSLPVLPGEKPWTKAEVDEVLADLHDDRARVVRTLTAQEEELAGLMRDAGDGAGHDQADMGATSFERDQELTVVNNEREKLAQIDRALARIADGTYGICESCGNPIGKGRAMAFPRATLCLTCKQREERR